MASVMKMLARLFGRHHRDDARQEKANLLIQEGDKVISGRDLYTEIATKNATEAAADMKAWYKKRDTYLNYD